jgi:acetyl esterase/lipase
MKQSNSTLIDNLHEPIAEHTTQAYLDTLNNSGLPAMETLSAAEARKLLEDAQKGVAVAMPAVEISKKNIKTDGLSISLTIVRPANVQEALPVFMFFHGGGWVLGDFPTHERLVRDLVSKSGAVAVFVNYSRSPEARYPVAVNETYAATKWVAEHGKEINVDGSRLAVVGNSVGGNLAAAVALKAKEHGLKLRLQVLLWPVTDANFDTPSYLQYQEGHALTRNMMKWFWDSYTTNNALRNEIYASPLKASLKQLKGLPPTLIQTAELDVLRDEGQAYARKLDQAGVPVTSICVGGMIHDYGLLNALSAVPAVQEALQQAAMELQRHLK